VPLALHTPTTLPKHARAPAMQVVDVSHAPFAQPSGQTSPLTHVALLQVWTSLAAPHRTAPSLHGPVSLPPSPLLASG
jgi:hypothetical protein